MRLSQRTTPRFSDLSAAPSEPWEPWEQEDGNSDDGQGHASEDDPELSRGFTSDGWADPAILHTGL